METLGERVGERAGERAGLTAWVMAELTPGEILRGARGEAKAVVGAWAVERQGDDAMNEAVEGTTGEVRGLSDCLAITGERQISAKLPFDSKEAEGTAEEVANTGLRLGLFLVMVMMSPGARESASSVHRRAGSVHRMSTQIPVSLSTLTASLVSSRVSAGQADVTTLRTLAVTQGASLSGSGSGSGVVTGCRGSGSGPIH